MKKVLTLLAVAVLILGAGVLAAQSSDKKIYELSDDGVTAPKLLEAANPGYTDEAKKKKIEGEVVLTIIVDEKGDVTQPKVKKGLGFGLDESAIEAAKMFKYKPAEKDGVAIKVKMEISFTFYLGKE